MFGANLSSENRRVLIFDTHIKHTGALSILASIHIIVISMHVCIHLPIV